MDVMKDRFNKYSTAFRGSLSSMDRGLALMMVPAAGFILFGLLAVLAPKLILFLVAAFCIFFGLIFGTLAYKFWRLKSKFEEVAKNYQGQVIVQGVNLADIETQVLFEDEEEDEEDPNITFH